MADLMISGKPGVGPTEARQLVAVLYLLFSVSSFAEDLPDPTRPPASIYAPVAVAVAGQVATSSTSAGLRSIIISKSRRAAIVDGQTVELYGMHGGAKLVEVNEGSVVFQGAQGRREMTLFPDVKMTNPVVKMKNNDMKINSQTPVSKVRSGKHKSTARPGKHKSMPVAHKEEK